MGFDISVNRISQAVPFLKYWILQDGSVGSHSSGKPTAEFLFSPLSTLLPFMVLNMVLKVACLLILFVLFILYCY